MIPSNNTFIGIQCCCFFTNAALVQSNTGFSHPQICYLVKCSLKRITTVTSNKVVDTCRGSCIYDEHECSGGTSHNKSTNSTGHKLRLPLLGG